MMEYNGSPAKAPPGYEMAGQSYPQPHPPTTTGNMYPAPNPIPAQGHTYPALNPTPAPAPAMPVIMSVPVGPEPSRVTCPSCRSTVITRVESHSTTNTHLAALVLCLFTGCCCLPYLFDCCVSANHYCPNCSAFLGSYAK